MNMDAGHMFVMVGAEVEVEVDSAHMRAVQATWGVLRVVDDVREERGLCSLEYMICMSLG